MQTAFLDAARLGRNDWWRYLIGLGLVFFMAFILGAVPLLAAVLVVLFDGNPATSVSTETGLLVGVDPLLMFPLLMCSFVAWMLGLVLAVEVIHRRRSATLVRANGPVRWGRMAQGFGVWVLLIALVGLLEAVLFPGRYTLTFNPAQWLPFALMALVLVPIQAASEELFFRGYLLQALGLFVRSPLVVSLVTGLMFALLHFANPEVQVDFWLVMGYYLLFGLAMALITLRDNGLELAIGAHVGNNLFGSLLATFEGSALETPAIFTASGFDPLFNLLAALAVLLLFYVLVFPPRRGPAPLRAADAAGQD